MKEITYSKDLNEEQRQEIEDNLYEDLVKASSNSNLFLGLSIAVFILYGLVQTYLAMRGNDSFTGWIERLATSKVLVAPLLLLVIFGLFLKLVREIRFRISLITEYDQYKSTDADNLNGFKKFKLLNAMSNFFLLGIAFYISGLFIHIEGFPLSVFSCVAIAIGIVLNAISNKYN